MKRPKRPKRPARLHRGLTLIELLLSLGLLAAILGVSASWITISGRNTTIAAGPLRWEALTQAALRCIEDDLVLGDFEVGGSEAERIARRKSHMQLSENRLTIKGRGEGGVPSTFTYRVENRWLVRSSGAHESTRLLVPAMRFEAEVDDEYKRLTIALVSEDGRETSRKYRLP